jgi:putative mRNA 3-end processing factor
VPLLEVRDAGLYCPHGDFHIDPWAPVPRAVITHAHSDHVAQGSRAYLTSRAGEALLRARLNPDAAVQSLPFGERLALDGVTVSLHPSGHILGAAQVRIERGGEVWVVSGDYKLAPDRTCPPFEPLRCHGFVTESTFALPVFRWPEEREVFAEIHAWWRASQVAGKAGMLFAHPLGKAQRLLAGLDVSIGPIHVHESVERLSRLYREQGVALPAAGAPGDLRRALAVAPLSARGSAWARRFGTASTALASGWMRIRGARRRRSLDRGFVLSDHADWPALVAAIDETRAETVWVGHGYRAPLVRWLQEHGREAVAIETHPVETEP